MGAKKKNRRNDNKDHSGRRVVVRVLSESEGNQVCGNQRKWRKERGPISALEPENETRSLDLAIGFQINLVLSVQQTDMHTWNRISF